MSDEGWRDDPTGRHESRFFDGAWTPYVSDRGLTSADFEGALMLDARAEERWTDGEELDPVAMSERWGFPPGHIIETDPRSNGFAVAALATGIVSVLFGLKSLWFYLSLVLATIALVAGALGWVRTRKGAGHAWMAIVGGIAGLAGLVLGLMGLVDVLDDSGEVTGPFEFEPVEGDNYTVEVDECGRNDSGIGEATGTISNTSDATHDFFITVYFMQDGVRIGEASDFVTGLPSGASSDWTALGLDLIPDGVLCETIVT